MALTITTPPMFSTHLIPWKPFTDNIIWTTWNRRKNSTTLSYPNMAMDIWLMAEPPSQVWNPYHTIAGRPRIITGTMFPFVPYALLS